MKNNLTDHTNDIIYLKDYKVRHAHAITSLKINNCSNLLQETVVDSTFHAKTFKTVRQGQAQVQEDIYNLRTFVSTHDLKISLNGALGPTWYRNMASNEDIEGEDFSLE